MRRQTHSNANGVPFKARLESIQNFRFSTTMERFQCVTIEAEAMLDTQALILAFDLSNLGPGEYFDGKPARNSWCWFGY